jgi:hypothetical protein
MNYSPFRCDIENCSLVPQLHEGIVLRKIIVKKKIAFVSLFYGDAIVIFSEEQFFPVMQRT